MRIIDRISSINPAWRVALAVYTIARLGLTAWSLVILLLFPMYVQNLDLFDAKVLVSFDLMTSERYAFARQVEGTTLTFRSSERGYVMDSQTGSTWSLREGRAVAGPWAGRTLNASPYPVDEIFPYWDVRPEASPLLALWQRFDVNWYLAIAKRGYGSIPGDVHFPPLYPILVRIGGAIIHNDFVAALLISNLSLIAALALLYQMTQEWADSGAARRTVAYLMVFPTAYFFFSAYTEPSFLLVSLLALQALQRERWLWAGFWTFCGILIRLQGIALTVPLLFVLWQKRAFDHRLARFVSVTLPVVALALYLLIRAVGGDSAIIPTVEANLNARLAAPWENYGYALQTLASGQFQFADLLNLLIATVCLVVLILSWRRSAPVLSLYMASSLILISIRLVDGQPLNSFSRYVLSLFPFFMWLGVQGASPWIQRAIVYPSLALSLYLSAQFFLWGWVA